MVVGVRHAAVWNPEGVVYARLPGFHLSESGRAEAEQLSRELSSVEIASIQASPLERAVQTASILAEPYGLDIRVDERLLEWSFWSHWEGLPWTGIRARDPELLEGYASDPASAWPQDPLASAGERVLAWAADAERAYPDGLVLGVTHEAPLLAALLLGSGRSLATYHATNLPHLGTVRLRPGPAEVVDLADWAARAC